MSEAGRVLQARLVDGRPPSRQVNVLLTEGEAERIGRLAKRLNWSKRELVVTATKMLEVELKAIEDGEAVDHFVETPKWAFDWAMEQVNAHYDGQTP